MSLGRVGVARTGLISTVGVVSLKSLLSLSLCTFLPSSNCVFSFGDTGSREACAESLKNNNINN